MPYSARHTGQLADLILRQGELAADRAQRSGQMWGGIVSGLASIPAGIQQRKAAEQAAQLEHAQVASRLATDDMTRRNIQDQIDQRGNARMDEQATKDLALTTQKVSTWLSDVASAPDPESQKAAYKAGRDALVAEGRLTPQDAPEFFPGASWVKSRMAMLLPAAERFKQLFPEPAEPIEVSPGASLYDPTKGTGIYTAPKPEEPRAPVELNEGAVLVDPVTGKEIARGNPRREPAGTRQPIWVIKDGKFIDLAGVAPPGSTPASAREQGRAVTSGDAGRIAELDTSLDDLNVLRQTVLPVDPKTGKPAEFATTGTAAKAGAMLWNPISEFTGWGQDAKSRQAVIDRVKQVIGKALEEGVLRKEDEIKYEKILPTIGDTAAVVETKLKGLEQAIALRRQRTIEALADAGYDTSRFEQRGAGGAITVGAPVTWNGKKYRVKAIVNGEAELEPLP